MSLLAPLWTAFLYDIGARKELQESGSYGRPPFWIVFADIADIWMSLALGRPLSDLFRGLRAFAFEELAVVEGGAASGGAGAALESDSPVLPGPAAAPPMT